MDADRPARRRAAPRGPWLLALVLAAAVAPGCISSAGPRDTRSWFEARGADLMDTFGVRLAVGAGLGAYVRVTEYAQFGGMMRGPGEATLPRPEGATVRSVPCFMVGTIGRYGGAWFDSTREFMLPGWSSRDSDALYIEREIIAGYVSPYGRRDDWRGSVGAGLHVLLVGAEAEIRPWEIYDFLAGLVGYDPSGDDVPVASVAPPDGETPAAPDDET